MCTNVCYEKFVIHLLQMCDKLCKYQSDDILLIVLFMTSIHHFFTRGCQGMPSLHTVGFWCQTIYKKFLWRFDTIFGLKIMVKSGIDCFLNYPNASKVAANWPSQFSLSGRFSCTGQQQLWKGFFYFQTKYLDPLFQYFQAKSNHRNVWFSRISQHLFNWMYIFNKICSSDRIQFLSLIQYSSSVILIHVRIFVMKIS